MNLEPSSPAPEGEPLPQRLFLLESGWRVFQKVGSSREFCFMMSPGQDYYHRVHDGEILVQRGDERLCLACAQRRGLLAFAPKALRETTDPSGADSGANASSNSEFGHHPGSQPSSDLDLEIELVDEADQPE